MSENEIESQWDHPSFRLSPLVPLPSNLIYRSHFPGHSHGCKTSLLQIFGALLAWRIFRSSRARVRFPCTFMSLASDVLESQTATGNELLSYVTCLLYHIYIVN